MPYTELSGNIFNSKADALVNTVNCMGVMGKGIALEFRRRYPEMFKAYNEICQKGLLSPGQIQPYTRHKPIILNFAIKNDWRYNAKLEWIESCLEKFVKNYKRMNIRSAALPWIGAINGGIHLTEIKTITRRYLSELDDISIEVYTFDKYASDPLFARIKQISEIPDKSLDLKLVSKASGIRPKMIDSILKAIRSGECVSFATLIESGIIGKTSVEHLYSFLISPDSEPDKFRSKPLNKQD